MPMIQIEGAWHSNGVTPEKHFFPIGLPAALCGALTGRYHWPSGTNMDRCLECSGARDRIELEMALEAAQQPTPRPGGESAG